jgi:hypothetical protein
MESMTGKRMSRTRYAPLKVGQKVTLKKDEQLLGPTGKESASNPIARAGTTGQVIVPKLLSGNPVIEFFFLDRGTQNYEVERSNLRVVAKPKKKKPAASCVPIGFDLLSPTERMALKPMSAKNLATSLANQRRAKRAMSAAIEHYAVCTANVSHARRLANVESGLT